MRHSFWFSFLHGRSASAGETHHHYGMPFLNAVPFNIQAIQDRFHILRCCCYMQSKDVFNLKLGSQWTSFLSASDPASVHLDICAWMFLRTGQSCCSQFPGVRAWLLHCGFTVDRNSRSVPQASAKKYESGSFSSLKPGCWVQYAHKLFLLRIQGKGSWKT